MEKILVIIPAYNESANILAVVDQVKKAGYDYVVVNDGSTDETLALCMSKGINVVNLHQNLGIGGAIQTGHRYALQNGYNIDIQFDGDGQHDVSYISVLLEQVRNGYDLVIGSRFITDIGEFKSSSMRRVGIRWLKAWIKLFTGQSITDATSGFRACGVRAIQLFAANYPSDYPEPESIVMAHKHGLKCIEAPVVMHERQGGKSSIGALSGAYYMIKVSLAIMVLAITGKKESGE